MNNCDEVSINTKVLHIDIPKKIDTSLHVK